MNFYIFGFLVLFITTVLAVVGMLLVRRFVGISNLASYHEVAGYLLSVVGTLYAVLLGFVVVDAMQHVQDLRNLVDQEASSLCNIYLCANGLPEKPRTELRKNCIDYADSVINDEWHAMEKGQYSVRSFTVVWKIWKQISTYVPEGEAQQTLHQQLVSEVCSMTQNRRMRITSSAHGIAPLMWTVLIVGGVFTLLFTYFFAVESVRAQVIMTVLVALTLSLNIYLVFIFGSPFTGDFGVKPDSFRLDQMIFKYFDAGSPPPPGVPF
jgi:hypothetical protein